MKDANVEFCKAFWQLTETDIVQVFVQISNINNKFLNLIFEY